jgi:hypothetical protein
MTQFIRSIPPKAFSGMVGDYKVFFVKFLRYSYVRIYVLLIILTNALCWGIALAINNKETTDLTILSYNVDFGNTMVGLAKTAYLLPLIGMVIFTNNFILSAFISSMNKISGHVLLSAAFLANLIISAGLAFVYFINFHW